MKWLAKVVGGAAEWMKAGLQFTTDRFARLPKAFHALYQNTTPERLTAIVNAGLNNIIRLFWIAVAILVVVFIMQNISGELITIEPISVPKVLSDNGYTQEVASSRLRDALHEFVQKAGSSMKNRNFSLRGETPNIIVPKIELSLEALTSSIRQLLHFGNRRSISGEITIHGNLAWLRLRIDGKQAYSSPNGFELERPDELLSAAVPDVIGKTQPYLVASALYDKDPMQSLKTANAIIARLPKTDVNVEWSYVLRALFSNDHEDYIQGERQSRNAISLNWYNPAAHNNLGIALTSQGKVDEGISEYRLAIKIDPKNAYAHYNLGNALTAQGKAYAAIDEYRLAIEANPDYSVAHNNLGLALANQGRAEEAIDEYRLAISIKPKDSDAHNNLGVELNKQGKIDEAIAEYRLAIEANSKNAYAHNNLGLALFKLGKVDDAIIEFRLASEADPNFEYAHINLDMALARKDQKN